MQLKKMMLPLNQKKKSQNQRSRKSLQAEVEVSKSEPFQSGSIEDLMRDKRLRWYGHVERSVGSWIDRCRTEPEVEGGGKVGRPPKSWKEVLNSDFRERDVSSSWTKDRDRWRAACRGDPFVHRDPRLRGGRRRPFSSE